MNTLLLSTLYFLITFNLQQIIELHLQGQELCFEWLCIVSEDIVLVFVASLLCFFEWISVVTPLF